jgi:hypothetical protein
MLSVTVTQNLYVQVAVTPSRVTAGDGIDAHWKSKLTNA